MFARCLLILCFFFTRATFASTCEESFKKNYRFPLELFTGGKTYIETIVIQPKMRTALKNINLGTVEQIEEIRSRFPHQPYQSLDAFLEISDRMVKRIKPTVKEYNRSQTSKEFSSETFDENRLSALNSLQKIYRLPYFLEVLNAFEAANGVSIVSYLNHLLEEAASTSVDADRRHKQTLAITVYSALTKEIIDRWIMAHSPYNFVFALAGLVENASSPQSFDLMEIFGSEFGDHSAEFSILAGYYVFRTDPNRVLSVSLHLSAGRDEWENTESFLKSAIAFWLQQIKERPVFLSSQQPIPLEFLLGMVFLSLPVDNYQATGDVAVLYPELMLPFDQELSPEIIDVFDDYFLRWLNPQHPERLAAWIRLQKSPLVGDFGRFILDVIKERVDFGREQALDLATKALRDPSASFEKFLEISAYLTDAERVLILEESLIVSRAEWREWNDDQLESLLIKGLWKKPLEPQILETMIERNVKLLESPKVQAAVIRDLPLMQVLRYLRSYPHIVDAMLSILSKSEDIGIDIAEVSIDEALIAPVRQWLRSSAAETKDVLLGILVQLDRLQTEEVELIYRRWHSRRTPRLTSAMQKMAQRLPWSSFLEAVQDDVWDETYVKALLSLGEWFGLTPWQRLESVLQRADDFEATSRALITETVLGFITTHELWPQVNEHTTDVQIGRACASLIYLSTEGNVFRHQKLRDFALQAREEGSYFALGIITKEEKRRTETKVATVVLPQGTKPLSPRQWLEEQIRKRDFDRAFVLISKDPNVRNQLKDHAIRDIVSVLYRHGDYQQQQFDDRDRQWFKSLSLNQLDGLLASPLRTHYRFALAALRYRLRIGQDRDLDTILLRLANRAQEQKSNTRRRTLIADLIFDMLRKVSFQTSPASFASLMQLFREDFQLDVDDQILVLWASKVPQDQSAELLSILKSRMQFDARGIPLPRTLIHWQRLQKIIGDPSLARLHSLVREALGVYDVTNFATIWPQLLVNINHPALRDISTLDDLKHHADKMALKAVAEKNSLPTPSTDDLDSLEDLFRAEDEAGIAHVMLHELQEGRVPFLVDGDKDCGYDILSVDLAHFRYHQIEVKTKFDGYRNVVVSRNQASVAAASEHFVNYWPQYAVVRIHPEAQTRDRRLKVDYFSGIDHQHSAITTTQLRKLKIPRWYLEQYRIP